MSKTFIDLTGQRFGRHTVTSRAPRNPQLASRSVRWNCICDCGKQHTVNSNTLRTGNSQSCGCWNVDSHKTHGLPRYFRDAFYHANRRCTDPSHRSFKHYGGRGIEFRFTSLEQFAAELGERPSSKHSIDRIDNDGHYEPGNLAWSTRSEQMLNQRKRTPAQMAHLDRARTIRWQRHKPESGYIGVTRHKNGWRARAGKVNLGTRSTPDAAVLLRDDYLQRRAA
jgi:hypothetical protein